MSKGLMIHQSDSVLRFLYILEECRYQLTFECTTYTKNLKIMTKQVEMRCVTSKVTEEIKERKKIHRKKEKEK